MSDKRDERVGGSGGGGGGECNIEDKEEHGGEEGIGVGDKRDGEIVGIEVEWETANRAGCEGGKLSCRK